MADRFSMKVFEEATKKILEHDKAEPPKIVANRKSFLHPLNWPKRIPNG